MAAKKGSAKPEYTENEKIDLVGKICNLYASNTFSIASCCESVGISDRLFRYWIETSGEFSDLYKKAKAKSVEIYWDRLREKAQTGLERLVEGETYTETKHEVGVTSTGSINKTTETEVTVLPNPTSVIFALKGEYPERFVERQDITSKGKEIGQSPFANMTPERQAEYLRLLIADNAANP